MAKATMRLWIEEIWVSDSQAQGHNLKLRCFTDQVGDSVELLFPPLVSCLSSVLELDEGVAPITVWHEITPSSKSQRPRDIIMEMADLCIRQKILRESRAKEGLQFWGLKINVFPDTYPWYFCRFITF